MNRSYFKWFFFGFLFFMFILPAATGNSESVATDRGWTPEIILKVKSVGNVRVSPDGKQVVFTVREAIMTGDKSEYLTHIHMARTDGSPAFQFTRGEKSCTSPRWSPDGRWLAFTSSRSGKINLYIIPVNGGEARQLTDVQTGVIGFRWSPDGKSIAFTQTEALDEDQEKKKKAGNDAHVVDEDFKMTHIWLIPVRTDGDKKPDARQITRGDFTVGSPFGGGFDWSPDSKSIAFTHTPTPRVDDWVLADISIADVASGKIKPLVNSGAAEIYPFYSPDGRWIAFTKSDDPPTWGFTSRIHIIEVDSGKTRPLANTHDRQPGIIGWSPDGKTILYTEIYRTLNRLSALPTDGGPPDPISNTDKLISGVNVNHTGGHIGFTSQNPTTPPEAYISPLDGFRPLPVSRVQQLPDLPLGRTEIIRWQSTDGTPIEGFLTHPVGDHSGQKVPLLVIVHGGPAGVFVRRFIANRGAYPISAFASRGYAVLRCNVRGSSGYGKTFRYANYSDWGGGDYQDIMTGIDHLIEKGIADGENLGIMGWSYGGYMTSWVITQTDRFKAASVGAGVTNLMSFTGTADISGFIPDYFQGEYWDVFDRWRSRSAMFNIKGVATPTLIQHGEKDARVPVSQGYELYNALKRQGVDVKMVTYPRQPHGIREPRLLMDAMQRNLDWFDTWIKEKE